MPSVESHRRSFLSSAGKGLLSIFAGTAVGALFPRRADAQIFANLFLEKNRAIRVPAGYYDERFQLYFDATNRQPMFVNSPSEPMVKLSAQDFKKLVEDKWTVQSPNHPSSKLAQSCTLSRNTSYSTTTCCPIVTDSQSDTGCDDTPGQ